MIKFIQKDFLNLKTSKCSRTNIVATLFVYAHDSFIMGTQNSFDYSRIIYKVLNQSF